MDTFINERIILNTNVFYRKQSENIDWISEDGGKLWKAENIGSLNVKGYEQKILFNLNNRMNVNIAYSYAQDNYKKQYLSKYVFRYPTHNFTFFTNFGFPFDISGSIVMTLKKRKNETK